MTRCTAADSFKLGMQELQFANKHVSPVWLKNKTKQKKAVELAIIFFKLAIQFVGSWNSGKFRPSSSELRLLV